MKRSIKRSIKRLITVTTTFGLSLGLLLLATSSDALAHRRSVGLGVAMGAAYSPSQLDLTDVGSGFGWGFFVDIPLIDTFVISPAAMLRNSNLGEGKRPITDIDLNFKFLVPIGKLSLGVGVLGGITSAEKFYGHYGALAYLGMKVVSNLELFLLGQYKQTFHDTGTRIDDLHLYAGTMFRF